MQQNKKSSIFSAFIKDADMKQGIITGYFASFGTLDSDNDIILPGAFDKTIAEMGPAAAKPRIKHLLNHDPGQPIGKLLILKPDAKGLYYESQAGTNAVAVDVLKMIDSGLITEHSIGYGVVKKTVINPDADWREQQTQLQELKLYEGSSLTAWGANADTPLLGVKLKKKAVSYLPKLIAAIRNGTFTDETFVILEKELLFLQKAIDSDETTEPSVKDNGMVCPGCGSDDVEPDDDFDESGLMKCNKCNTIFAPVKSHEITQPNDERNLLNEISLLNSRLSLTI